MKRTGEEIETDLRNMVHSVASGYTSSTRRNLSRKITALVRAVRADEREECAKVAYEEATLHHSGNAVWDLNIAEYIAAAIRKG